MGLKMRPDRRQIYPLLDVILVLLLFLTVRIQLKEAGFGGWQDTLFGASIVSSALLFFVLPVLATRVRRLSPGAIGLSMEDPNYHWRVARMAIAHILPVTVLFPLIGLIGSSHQQWPGAMLLTLGFVAAGAVFARHSRKLETRPTISGSWRETGKFVWLLAGGLVLSLVLHRISPLAARLVAILVFVGFLEEFFFRGYVQSRLNDAFGRPFRFADVQFGPGLILTALIFGLLHPITAADGRPWAWALWTAAGGLVFGFVREKTGSVVSPAILHGAIVLPSAFFAAP